MPWGCLSSMRTSVYCASKAVVGVYSLQQSLPSTDDQPVLPFIFFLTMIEINMNTTACLVLCPCFRLGGF